MNKDFKIIVSIIVENDGKILMVKEGKPHCRNQWNIPSGGLEHGEKITEGAYREFLEETGCEVKLEGVVGIYRIVSERKSNCLRIVFSGKIKKESIKYDNDEILDVQWIDLEKIMLMDKKDLRKSGEAKKILKEYKKGKFFPLNIFKN